MCCQSRAYTRPSRGTQCFKVIRILSSSSSSNDTRASIPALNACAIEYVTDGAGSLPACCPIGKCKSAKKCSHAASSSALDNGTQASMLMVLSLFLNRFRHDYVPEQLGYCYLYRNHVFTHAGNPLILGERMRVVR